jgi:hypothetical protein
VSVRGLSEEVWYLSSCVPGGGLDVCAAPMGKLPAGGQAPGDDVLALWAEGLAGHRLGVRGRGQCLRV